MKILIVGSGAKEYSLAMTVSQYEDTELVFVAPGNDAIGDFANCVDINADDIDNLLDFVKANNIDITIACSEKAIESGIGERFCEQGLLVFAPTSESARIATSKSVAKKFMYKTKIPTPKFGIFDRENVCIDYVRKSKFPVVIKTDGHAHGENVYVCDNFKIAKRIVETLFDSGEKKVIVEDYIAGQEFSYYVITDGYNAMPLTSVVPYKSTLEGNGGIVTSGLGAYAPFYMIDRELESQIFKNVIYPALDELSKNNNQYIGILGVDMILDRDRNLHVLEFNPFFKEPDAQCVMSLLSENIVDMMKSAVDGSLVDVYNEISMSPMYSVSLVLSSGNYPNGTKFGNKISGINDAIEHCDIAHFNTKMDSNGNYLTAGGRTLVLTTCASTLEKASENLYECVEFVKFESMKYRRDIGKTVFVGC